MSMETIITQILALTCNTYCAFAKKKQNIYIATMLFNLFCLLTGFFQNNYALVVSYIIIMYRSVILLRKDSLKAKIPWLPITFIIGHLIFGFITWQSLWDIIPMMTPIITGCVLWYSDNIQIYRYNNILNASLWGIHNVWSQSYILVIVRVYTVIVNIVALIMNRKHCRQPAQE